MRRAAEILAFLGLSTALHAAVLTAWPEGGAGDAGQGGADRATIQPAPEAFAALVDRWTKAPEAAEDPPAPSAMPEVTEAVMPTTEDAGVTPSAAPMPPRATAPDTVPVRLPQPLPVAPAGPAPVTALRPPRPEPEAVHPATPRGETDDLAGRMPRPDLARPSAADAVPPAIAPPETALAVATSPRPGPRPPHAQPAPAPQAASAPRPAQQAEGSGGAGRQGSSVSPTAQTLSTAARNSLMAEWATRILARIERSRARGAGAGVVTLRLVLARDGRLQSIAIARSSGNPAVDAAGIAAVRRAGRFPAAPDGLAADRFPFDLPIRFQ